MILPERKPINRIMTNSMLVYELIWDGNNFANRFYYYRTAAGEIKKEKNDSFEMVI